MNSTPGSAAAAAGGRGRATLRPSQVSFNRLFVVGYLQVGDILSITIENTTHPFTVRLFLLSTILLCYHHNTKD